MNNLSLSFVSLDKGVAYVNDIGPIAVIKTKDAPAEVLKSKSLLTV